ncbi:MAG: hypothetical protein AB8G11_12590 [Saprospiraceae bacterium]
MNKIIGSFLIFISSISILSAQERFEIETSAGWNFYNYFNNADFYDDFYIGYGAQYGLDLWYSKKLNRTFDVRLGMGYAHFQHLDFAVVDPSHYGSLRLGTDIQTFWKPMKFTSTLSSYMLLHPELQDRLQRRFFTNLDLGLKFKMGDRFALRINSPITIAPMFQDDDRLRIFSGIGGGSFLVDADVEVTGANIGLIYNFKNRDKNGVPPMQFSGVEGNLEVEVSGGLLYYDLISSSEDILNYQQSFAWQSSVDFWLSKQVNPKFDARIGLGYSNFYHINSNIFVGDTAQSSSYLNVRLGTDIQSRWEAVQFSVVFSNYIHLARNPQDFFEYQQRIFTNLDLGAKFKINEKLSIRATTPITLAPMLRGLAWGYVEENELIRVPNSRVGTAGLNLGLIYKLGE